MAISLVLEWDVGQWLALEDTFQEAIQDSMILQRNLFRDIRQDLYDGLIEEITAQKLDYTRTYRNSIFVDVAGTKDNPELLFGFRPVGPQAERLHLYYPVLEHGSAPIDMVPKKPIIAWADKKLGVGKQDGGAIAMHIQMEGVDPNPILERFFDVDEDGQLTGLTEETFEIAEKHIDAMMEKFEEAYVDNMKNNQTRMRSTLTGQFVAF